MRILYVTTISLTMNSFFKPHIQMLVEEGNQVDIACNYNDLELDQLYSSLGCKAYQIDFSRSPLSPDNAKAFGQLKKVIENGNYDIVHCHTPNASVITRLVCRKFRKTRGLRVFYTAHGFHFYKGAPKLNWMVYYPVEKFCSRFTDKLITINKEDYELAKNKFYAKEVHYVPGVGIDLSRFQNIKVDRNAKRREIGVPDDCILLISIGELSRRKNHKLVIQAIKIINDDRVRYIIGGSGELLEELEGYTSELGVSDKVHFLGYRRDIAELYKISDIYCFPSIHEGLPVALMEAMACGLPSVCSMIRGNTDLLGEDSEYLAEFEDVNKFASLIKKLIDSPALCIENGLKNKRIVKNFETEVILNKLREIYAIH